MLKFFLQFFVTKKTLKQYGKSILRSEVSIHETCFSWICLKIKTQCSR